MLRINLHQLIPCSFYLPYSFSSPPSFFLALLSLQCLTFGELHLFVSSFSRESLLCLSLSNDRCWVVVLQNTLKVMTSFHVFLAGVTGSGIYLVWERHTNSPHAYTHVFLPIHRCRIYRFYTPLARLPAERLGCNLMPSLIDFLTFQDFSGPVS